MNKKLAKRQSKFAIILLITLLFAIVAGQIKIRQAEAVGELLYPLSEVQPADLPTNIVELVEQPAPKTIDELIEFYAHKYTNSERAFQYRKFQLHCLYWKESSNGMSTMHGDNGKAGGPFQFWQDTYNRMRNKMIDTGQVNHLGTRYDFEDALETTSWALQQGYGDQWGPVLRGDCK